MPYCFSRSLFAAGFLSLTLTAISCRKPPIQGDFIAVRSLAGTESGLVEPFGIAVKNGDIFVSDGERGKVSTLSKSGLFEDVVGDFDTPSGIAFGPDGVLYVSDTSRNVIYKLDGEPTIVAGSSGQRGSSDGGASDAAFNGPTGLAISKDGKIFVSDTYNDRIRLIENGKVTTLAGNSQGFADGPSPRFDTPLGIALWGERLLVADAGNRRIRVVEPDGSAWTLAGSGANDHIDGFPGEAGFVRPTAIAVSADGVIYIADGNAIRAIGKRPFPFVETISNDRRGFRDGNPFISRFNRPSGLAIDERGQLFVADSDNGLIRAFQMAPNTEKEVTAIPKQVSADEFRKLQPPRWPYDPPEAKRDIAGTLGEIRGELVDDNSQVWFHNGLDIAGSYGETARFVRSEKILDPLSTENFGTLRELIRMPTMGYFHIRLGRDVSNRSFGDPRFLFSEGNDGNLNGVRIPRGTKFSAGEAIGTLNQMNHVHLIAGPTGSEMNALAALELPNVRDSIAPTIENVALYDENWRQFETERPGSRITLSGRVRIVARAYDRVDGNPERRRLGVYKLGYQVIRSDGSPLDPLNWTIVFDRNPPYDAVRTVYANGSRSGATGETIFSYIVTNRLCNTGFGEGRLETATVEPGNYTIRVFAADFFGNQTSKDIQIEVKR